MSGSAGADQAVDNLWFPRLLTCRDRLSALPRLRATTIAAIRGIGAKTLPRILAWQKTATFGSHIDLADTDIVADAAAILALDEQIKALNTRIETTAEECPMARRLRTIPSFGVIGTAELSGEIGALQRFQTERAQLRGQVLFCDILRTIPQRDPISSFASPA